MLSLRNFIGARPALFYPLFRLLRRDRLTRALLLNDETALVIEGFPRCGNSFAVLALQHAQREPVPIAHHLHHPAQVLRAVAWGVPAVVLIREPEAAVRSLSLRRPRVSVVRLIDQYVAFYEALEDAASGFLVVEFAALTTDFGRVTEAINARFDTRFSCFDHQRANEAAVFAQIERVNEALGGSEYDVSRPSPIRQSVPVAELGSRAQKRLARAQRVYERLTCQAGAVV